MTGGAGGAEKRKDPQPFSFAILFVEQVRPLNQITGRINRHQRSGGMVNTDSGSLEERVRRLENSVADLKSMVRQLLSQHFEQAVEPKPSVAPPPPPPYKPSEPPASVPPSVSADKPDMPSAKRVSVTSTFELPDHMKKVEFWLNKVGIGLLLFAVAFLFKYSIDKGWLTPWVRVGFGLGLGVALVILGYRTYEKRRHFSLVFLGGGIATFYITAFAAFQRLAIVSHPVAFAFMVLVTIFALLLSLKQNDSVLSLLGAIGGFGTPFMLYTGAGDIPSLITYTCILIAATMGIYVYRGWRSLLWVTVLAGWFVIVMAVVSGMDGAHYGTPLERKATQAGTLFALLAFWVVPVLREILRAMNPSKWTNPPLGRIAQKASSQSGGFLTAQAYWLTVTTPLIALAVSFSIWPGANSNTWGWITLVGAGVFWLASYGLHRLQRVENLAYTHLLEGILLLTLALCILLENNALVFSLAAEATVLHLVAMRTDDRGIKIGANIIFALVAFALLMRLLEGQLGTTSAVSSHALVDLWAIGCGLGLSFVFKSIAHKRIYFLLSYIALAGWFFRELDGNLLFVVITAQALVFHGLTYRGTDEVLRTAAHLGSLLWGFWLIGRMADRDTSLAAVFNADTAVNLLAIITIVRIATLSHVSWERLGYGVGAHVAFMLLLLAELSKLSDGQGYVTIAWGICGALLLVAGLQMNNHRFRITALATLFAVVGKLFLVDLAHIEAFFRILLFMGFGGVFLALSYYFRSLWKSSK